MGQAVYENSHFSTRKLRIVDRQAPRRSQKRNSHPTIQPTNQPTNHRPNPSVSLLALEGLLHMQVEMWSLDRIKPYEKNPRINDDAVAPVVQSINEFGFRQPIVVDPDGVIIVGHTRWKAAKQLNLAEVPVHVATDLEPEAVKAYRIADNRTGENAEWDYDLLPLEIGELHNVGFDCELLGFNSDELAKLLDPGVEPGLTDPDDVPGATRRSGHPTRRPVDPRRPPIAMRRLDER